MLYPKKTKNPNPSPIGNRFGFFLFGGRGWIRTTEAEKQQIYSLSPLATREHAHIHFLLSCGLPVYITTGSVVCQYFSSRFSDFCAARQAAPRLRFCWLVCSLIVRLFGCPRPSPAWTGAGAFLLSGHPQARHFPLYSKKRSGISVPERFFLELVTGVERATGIASLKNGDFYTKICTFSSLFLVPSCTAHTPTKSKVC